MKYKNCDPQSTKVESNPQQHTSDVSLCLAQLSLRVFQIFLQFSIRTKLFLEFCNTTPTFLCESILYGMEANEAGATLDLHTARQIILTYNHLS